MPIAPASSCDNQKCPLAGVAESLPQPLLRTSAMEELMIALKRPSFPQGIFVDVP